MSYEEADWQEAMALRFDFNNTMAEAVGPEHGIDASEVDEFAERCGSIHEELVSRRDSGELGFCELPYQDVGGILDFVAARKDRFDNFVVVGIGGSALGAIGLQSALRHPYHNLLTPEQRNSRPRMFFPDNVDPDRLKGLIDVLDLKRTLFNVVTKSGSTAETMSTFLLVRQQLQDQVGGAWKDHVAITTDPEKGDLRTLAEREGIAAFDIPPNVVGRFSVLTPVGLLPAAFSGVDIRELLAGASFMDRWLWSESQLWRNPAYTSATLQYIADTGKGKHLSVMMPYAHALRDVADWFRQIWAESLGKKHTLDGRVVHVGPTPIRALGATDQHSQIQLYVEGPFDKVVTFLAVDRYHDDLPFPSAYGDLDSLAYFAGATMSQLILSEQKATALALTKNHRPNVTITLPEVNPFTVGQLLCALEMQTVFSAALYQVNPLDQPGVEEGKMATYALMKRPGYVERVREMEQHVRADARYIIRRSE